mgnify:FL=1
MRAIYISINPIHLRRIENKTKNYEFRSFNPKEKIDFLYVYETVPTSSLKYIIKIGEIIEFPNKIDELGIGNKEFNEKLTKYKYAYQIKHFYELENPIVLKELREKYKFTPPQGYAYDTRYEELTKYIINTDKKIIF